MNRSNYFCPLQNGKLADELEYVSHNVRTKLDELKRTELERLRHLAVREYELKNGIDPDHLKMGEHVDHTNPDTFEIYDLKKLIAKVSKAIISSLKYNSKFHYLAIFICVHTFNTYFTDNAGFG
jgi:hypothetical protein